MRYTALVLLIVLIFSISVVQKNASGETEWKVYELSHEGQIFKIPYEFTNGDISKVESDADFASVIDATDEPKKSVSSSTPPKSPSVSDIFWNDFTFPLVSMNSIQTTPLSSPPSSSRIATTARGWIDR